MTKKADQAKNEASGPPSRSQNGSAAAEEAQEKAPAKATKKKATKKSASKATKKKTAKKSTKKAGSKASGAAEGPESTGETKKKKTTKKAGGKSLVIVESPAKARTINKYLGKDYVVRASMGHIRDLPKGKFGIDLEHDFEPEYTPIRGKAKVISELKKLAKSAPSVYLAPDLDREGEAIAWHLAESLDVDEQRIFRVVFNEITKKAILEAFSEPGKLEHEQGRRAAGATRARPDHGLQALAPALEEDRQGAVGRARAVRGDAADRRARARDPQVRQRGILARHRAHGGRRTGLRCRAPAHRCDRRIEKNLNEEEAKGLVAQIGSQTRCCSASSRTSRRRAVRRRPSRPASCSRRRRRCCASARARR